MAFSSAFQIGAFQAGAFQVLAGGTITDTDALQLPIDCVLAGQQPYKFRGREYEIRPMSRTARTMATRSGVRRLRGSNPSFTTTTNNRGYD